MLKECVLVHALEKWRLQILLAYHSFTTTDNNDMFCFLNKLSFLDCWYLVEKKNI